LLGPFALAACRSESSAVGGESDNESAATPKPTALPPLSLTDDTKNLLLTWIDDKGDFHVVQQIAEVPEDRREKVRVIVTTKPEGTGQLVYVANLAKKQSDGAYAVDTMTRAQWDAIGADKRKARLEALAPGAKPLTSAAPAGATGEVEATIYGADWCKPCHDAEHLLKKLGVTVTKLNIEKSAAAHREMQKKLLRVNKGGASIPVIDVGGQIFVGFNAVALKRAVEQARQRETL
jgi:glutaredoxin